jgi:hypothetical protein
VALPCSNSQSAFPIRSRMNPEAAAVWTVAFSPGSPTLFRSCRTRLGSGHCHPRSAHISRHQSSKAGLWAAEAFHATDSIGDHLFGVEPFLAAGSDRAASTCFNDKIYTSDFLSGELSRADKCIRASHRAAEVVRESSFSKRFSRRVSRIFEVCKNKTEVARQGKNRLRRLECNHRVMRIGA